MANALHILLLSMQWQPATGNRQRIGQKLLKSIRQLSFGGMHTYIKGFSFIPYCQAFYSV